MLPLKLLWQDHSLSDITVVLRTHDESSSCVSCRDPSLAIAEASRSTSDTSAEPSAKKPCRPSCCSQRLQVSKSQPRQPACTMTFQLHTVVLSNASSYFKALFICRLNGWCSACKTSTQVLEDHELEAAEHVLRFVYTDELPAGAVMQGGMLLLRMIQVADRWDAPACIKACKRSLCALNDNEFPISLMFSLPATFQSNAVITGLKFEAEIRLLRVFGDTLTVMCDLPTRTAWNALPHAAILTLLVSIHLRTDSEATVLILLADWYAKNIGTCTQLQLTALKKWIHYSRIDTLFLCTVVKQMPDFSLSAQQINELWTASAAGELSGCDDLRSSGSCPENWFLPERPGSVRSVKLQLKIPRSKLLSHVVAVSKMQNGGNAPERIYSEKMYGLGYYWRISLLSSKHDNDVLALGFEVLAPDGVDQQVAVKVLAKATGPGLLKQLGAHVLISGHRLMWLDLFGNADAVLAGDGSIEPWQKHMVDDCLLIDFEIEVLREKPA